MAAKTILLENRNQVIALLLIGGAEASKIAIGQIERGDAGILERRGSAYGEKIMHLANGICQLGRRDDPAYTPAGDGKRFAQAVNEDGAFAQRAESDGRECVSRHRR